jgi:hypothetical protein
MPSNLPRDARLVEAADASHKLTRPLILMRVSLFIEPGTYVPDMLTRVRILETVASVAQDRDYFSYRNPEARPVEASLSSALPTGIVQNIKDVSSTSGRDVVNAVVRFLPKSVTVGDAIKELAERIRTVPGVRTIRFDELNGRPLTVGGKPVVF